MAKDKLYFSIAFLIFNFLIHKAIEEECDSTAFCDSCTFCGELTNNYTSCFYYNMLCKKGSPLSVVNLLLPTLDYSPAMKNKLINLFKSDPDITSFCGQEEYNFENLEKEIIIFNSKDKKFPKDKYVHCHYSLMTKNVVEYEPYIHFQLSNNKDSIELRKLKFQLINFYINSDDAGDENFELIKYSDFSSSNHRQNALRKEKKVEIFLDFTGLNYEQPDTILEIKIKFNKIKDLSPSSSSSSPSSSPSSSSSSSSNITTIIGAAGGGGGLFLIIIVIVIFLCCRRPKNTSNVELNNVGNAVQTYRGNEFQNNAGNLRVVTMQQTIQRNVMYYEEI